VVQTVIYSLCEMAQADFVLEDPTTQMQRYIPVRFCVEEVLSLLALNSNPQTLQPSEVSISLFHLLVVPLPHTLRLTFENH